jgi:undecaprenyl-diphosphatase
VDESNGDTGGVYSEVKPSGARRFRRALTRHEPDLFIESRQQWITFAVAVAVMAVATGLAAGMNVPQFERSILHFFNGWPQALAWPVFLVMQLGSFYGATVVVVGALLVGRARLAFLMALSATTAWLMTELLKKLVRRPRPHVVMHITVHIVQWKSMQGFPSGHVAVVSAMAMVVSPYLKRGWKVVPWVVVAIVAVGRMYVGAHFPLDLVGGAAVGIAVGAVFNLLFLASNAPLRAPLRRLWERSGQQSTNS